MQHKKTITIFIIGALAVALAVGGIAYRTVFAASPATTSTSTTSNTVLTDSKWLGVNGFNGGYNNQNLADALGITIDALNTAYQNAYAAALKQAVTDGLITQAQADELATNGNAFPFGNRWGDWLTKNGLDFNKYLADALNITEAALKTAFQTAYNASIDQQVTNGNLTQTQADLMKGQYALYNDSTFQSSMQSAFSSAITAAVSLGVITQAQADQILSNSSNMFLPGMGGMGDLGGRGGPHGHGGGFMLNNNTLQPSATP